MPDLRSMQNDASLPLDINVVGLSPHAFGYKFWAKVPGAADWAVIGEGQTEDDVPDSFASGPFPDGTRIAYWTGVGGRKNSDFRLVVTFSQDGRIVVGGVDELRGRTTDHGGGVVERESILI
jgi:hypothetical protein